MPALRANQPGSVINKHYPRLHAPVVTFFCGKKPALFQKGRGPLTNTFSKSINLIPFNPLPLNSEEGENNL
jgi:hypothetical protein